MTDGTKKFLWGVAAGLAAAVVALYLWQKDNIGTELYLLFAAVIISALSAGMLAWLKKNGAKRFSELQ